jgi:hypothetical protein
VNLAAKYSIRVFSKIAYFAVLLSVMFFVCLGLLAKASLNGEQESRLMPFGVVLYKFPSTSTFMVVTHPESELIDRGLFKDRIISIDDCELANFDSLEAVYECVDLDKAQLQLKVYHGNQIEQFVAYKSDSNVEKLPVGFAYFGLDLLFLIISLSLSLLLFFKARHHLSGYLLSVSMLLNVCESQFFYYGSNVFSDVIAEAIRINLMLVVGPLALYFFPQEFSKTIFKSLSFIVICICIIAMQTSVNLFLYFELISLSTFSTVISIALVVFIVHFVTKFRTSLNTRERKQVLTMAICLAFGFVLYFPLVNFAGSYGFLIGRYIIPISIGIGVFFALMRYGLWQVDTIISKSATLSVLSVIAFSFWAGVDQGIQAVLNQTIGLSNKTVTAFLAAAISSFFIVPAYNFVSKSCDAFFNKNLHNLKRLFSKDILVLAETQNLDNFLAQVSEKMLQLTGAQAISIVFEDTQRLPEPLNYNLSRPLSEEHEYTTKYENFSYEVSGVIAVSVSLTFKERRINREIREEFKEGMDEMARALASCSRWNFLENKRNKLSPSL